MNTNSALKPNTRALVIGGGGAAGNAWALGLIAGLAGAGVDLTQADVVIGTSSGSTVAAQITSGPRPADLYASILTEVPPPPRGGAGSGGGAEVGPGRPVPISGQAFMDWSQEIIDTSGDAAEMRRRMAAAAFAMDTSDGENAKRWHDIVASRLPSHHWPEQRVLITALDARTAEPVVFDRFSRIELVDAVAASTSSGFAPFGPYRIGEDRYLNGAFRRNENADLAAGYGRVVVLSPFSGRSRTPAEWGQDLASQVADLRAGGSRVETVFPDERSGDVFDANALDPSTRRPAAQGGYEQGQALAGSLKELWQI